MTAHTGRRIGVVGHSNYAILRETLARIQAFAGREGVSLYFEEALREHVGDGNLLTPEMCGDLDLLLTLGGDGTLLRGARMVVLAGVPVLGINLGHLGFLTSAPRDEVESALAHWLAGEFAIDTRMVLAVHVEGADGVAGKTHLALNDAVLHKGGGGRVIRLSMRAMHDVVGSYSADGIILATPTGSTAYSLSAGGPIVSPSVDCIIATPICPHTLGVRPLVLPAHETVTVEVLSPSEELILTIDGQQNEHLVPGQKVVARRADQPVRLVRFAGQSFFQTLRRKLKWGDLAEREGA
ncbi:MAG TPA: NAD(+)/NADH kinase [Longimicrobium sp.]|nr:NAD(+)/NADH kinase [Longimicrobium sp.]